jgi:hypothetical protein
MKGGVQTAVALGVGYILGRRRKMRLATMLALGAATGGAAKLGPAAIRQGAKYIGKTDIAGALGPQVTEIVNTVRGELLDAAKGAAAAAVTSRIDSLSDNLHERAETLKNPEAAVGKVGETAGETAGRAGETVGRAGETVGRAGGKVGGLRRRGRVADIEDDDIEDEAEPDRDAEESGNGRVRRERSRASEEPDEYEEPADEYEEEEEDLDEAPADEADEPEDETDEPAPRRRRTTRSPVVRARR